MLAGWTALALQHSSIYLWRCGVIHRASFLLPILQIIACGWFPLSVLSALLLEAGWQHLLKESALMLGLLGQQALNLIVPAFCTSATETTTVYAVSSQTLL